MRSDAPALMPIFRSALQARLLLRVLTDEEPRTAADLARVLGEPEATVSREARRLLDSGLLRGERVGRAVLLRPAPDNPATEPLRRLLVVTFGPATILERALSDVLDIESAFVHGSWAARYRGETGGPPGDVDVVIVGHPSRRAIDVALEGVDAELGREVNVTHVSPDRWQDATDPFIATVRARPLVELDLRREPEPAG